MSNSENLSDLYAELNRLESRAARIRNEIARLENQGDPVPPQSATRLFPDTTLSVDNNSSPSEKVKLFRSLFRGRDDVYPKRFESRKTGKSGYAPVCANEWRDGVCRKPAVKCADCDHRQYLPVTDDVIERHLRGESPDAKPFVAGVYPMLPDETCRFLAADFDKATWEKDVAAFRDTAREIGVPVAVERSRSGNGAHAWVFFSEPVPCIAARKMGAYLLTETMERRPEVGLDSYDRFFPNQDTLPKGGFGNLIALPLQKRARDHGNSEFLDDLLVPHPDQWAYLSRIARLSRDIVETLARKASDSGRITGLRMPVTDEFEDRPWDAPPSGNAAGNIKGPFPQSLDIVLANQVFVAKADVSPSLRNALIRIAAFQNPEFYQKQAMRMPVWNVPRVISCAANFPQHIALPRGCFDDVLELLRSLRIEARIEDKRFSGSRIEAAFKGHLYPEQQQAADALLSHDCGILAATTAFGKTVVSIRNIAARGVNTLILVHRRQLMDQWVARLAEFLGLDEKEIGRIGGGKKKATGVIDVAVIQSLTKKDVVDDRIAGYGHLVIDECHHISAPSFEAVSREFKGRYVTGLSATVARKDGHHPVIYMNCGPIRFKVNPKTKAKERPFGHVLIVRDAGYRLPMELTMKENLPITDIYDSLMRNERRNALIAEDVLGVIGEGRNPVLLTERREHLELLREILDGKIDNIVVFQGGMGKKQRAAAREQLLDQTPDRTRLVLATGRYLGEGFDDPRLDTLFLALPISWRGTLAQYAGRLHRLREGKTEVRIYDYADLGVAMLARMFEKRLSGYKGLGYAQKG